MGIDIPFIHGIIVLIDFLYFLAVDIFYITRHQSGFLIDKHEGGFPLPVQSTFHIPAHTHMCTVLLIQTNHSRQQQKLLALMHRVMRRNSGKLLALNSTHIQ